MRRAVQALVLAASFVRIFWGLVPPMSTVFLPLALPFGLALAIAALARLAAGDGWGRRLASATVPVAFLAVWAWFRGVETMPGGPLDLPSHVALGGLLAGGILDATDARRRWRWSVMAAMSLICVWALLGHPADLPAAASDIVGLIGGALIALLIWGLMLGRLDLGRARGADGAALLAALALGTAGVAAATGASTVVWPALGLSMAALGFLAIAWPMGLPLGAAGAMGGGGAALTLAQGVAQGWGGAVVPLLILALGLFAGPTVSRLPGGERWRPLWLFLLVLLPGGLAGALALALGGGSQGIFPLLPPGEMR